MNMPQSQVTKPSFIAPKIEKGEYYILDLDADKKESFTIACGGLEQCSLDYQVERNHFKYFGIEYIVAGTCEITLNGEKYELSAGSLFSYTPNCQLKITNTGDTTLVKYFVDFSGDGSERIVQNQIFQRPGVLKPECTKWIAHVFQELQECGTLAYSQSQEICSHLLNYLIVRLDSVDVQEKPHSTPSYATFEACKSYLESNYSNIFSAHEVADMFHISHQYLCRLFKRFCDETPSQMLIRLKLIRSALLLEQGNLLVKEIAEKVGFEDQYYFSKRFKSYFGVSPRGYAASSKETLIA
ncbi:AraC family transcriptional regulator [Pelagicoccus mobilis]|uniref:Helix-turn-helix transcriptional regulator n=1 Tax=Pelagicoccus mobilis TaxID=415221 RepID=A0A934VP90_9BACT|nr:AraC family transcriptional regulator [Pelagicoccus mobilis]MBK1875288.1 helix-turn-helix transcriptional regulator [Pelagicoccus mobilis]